MVSRTQKVRRLPPLNSLRAFEIAARHLSFSLAAAELNVTQSAISRQIKGLEDYLGMPLFRRLPRSLELTEQGRRFAAPLHEAFEQLQRATETVLNEHRSTTLNINVLPTLAMKWLIPRLLHFTAANPNIEVRMVTSIRPVDFRVEEIDAAIRVGPALKRQKKGTSPIDLVMTRDWLDVRALPILPDALVPVCAPSLLKVGPPIYQPADLLHYTLIHNATREKGWPFWLQMMGVDDMQINHCIAYGHFFMAIQAAIEGKGIALVPSVLIEDDLRSGSLLSLFENKQVETGSYYLLGRESDWHNTKIERFREWLLKEAEDYIGVENLIPAYS
jgi:LysR family glycine cleavage system transcriptional activator